MPEDYGFGVETMLTVEEGFAWITAHLGDAEEIHKETPYLVYIRVGKLSIRIRAVNHDEIDDVRSSLRIASIYQIKPPQFELFFTIIHDEAHEAEAARVNMFTTTMMFMHEYEGDTVLYTGWTDFCYFVRRAGTLFINRNYSILNEVPELVQIVPTPYFITALEF